ncbi:MAG: glycosyltransferase family 2 protein [Candidatus Atribacteria bacterium]|nr:glycosyltransferase family 2 protein [Candidatus Atribacteria bacterium]
MEKLVSVIIPCYNAEAFVESAIKSICNQTYTNLEIICVDDKSTDGTLDVLKSLSSRDSRIKVIENETNLKLIKTLNKAIDLTSGEYIARMDADDISTFDRIEKQIRALEESEADFVSSYFSFITHQGKFHSKSFQLLACKTAYSCKFMAMFYPPVLHANTIFKASLLREYKYQESESAVHIEDFNLFSRLIINGYKPLVLTDYLYKYRRNQKSVSYLYADLQDENHIVQSKMNIQEVVGIIVENSVIKTLVSRNRRISIDDFKSAFESLMRIKNLYINNYQSCCEQEVKEVEDYCGQRMLEILLQGLLTKFSFWPFSIMFLIRNWPLLVRRNNIKYFWMRCKWVIGQLKERRV